MTTAVSTRTQTLRTIIRSHKRWDTIFGVLGLLAMLVGVLTLVALQFNATAGLPDVGYLLMLDQIYLASYGFVLLVVALLVMSTGKEDEAQISGGAEAITRGGPLVAFLAVLLYAAVIGALLFANLR